MRGIRGGTAKKAGAVLGALGVAVMVGVAPGSAVADDQGSGVQTTNTETVQTYLTPDGKITSSRLYEQLSLTGKGNVTVDNPVGPNSVRNLDGFGGISAHDGVVQQSYDVNGVSRARTVSNFDSSKLPISVGIKYTLNGKPVSAGDLVGATGDVAVTYTVKNLTAKSQPVSFANGLGGTKTENAQVPIPIVGTVVFDLPESYTQVQSKAASMGGDGHGGTQMEYLLTLFPPIGSDTQTFGFTAHLTNGVVPPVSFTAVPVDPLTNPTFTTAGNSYKSGAQSGTQLASGATTINTNLLKLRDGAGQLLDGLIKLSNGADQLHSGLAGQAAPGAQQLADGASQLNAGLAKIDDGAGRLAAGTSQANDGGQKLAAGLTTLHNALARLPQTLAHNHNYQLLLGALTKIADGVGSLNDPPTKKTILGGLNAIQQGLEVGPGNDCLSATIAGTQPKNCGAIDAVKTLALSLSFARSQGPGAHLGKLTVTSLGDLNTLAKAVANSGDCGTNCQTAVAALTAMFAAGGPYDQQLGLLQTNLNTIATKADQQLLNPGAGLDQLRAGLSHGNYKDCVHTQCGIKEAALAVQAGVPVLVDSLRQQILSGLGAPTPGCDPTKTLRCGAAALSNGLGQLDAGTQQLAGGTGKALDGSAQLANGAHQLSDGLNTAASGSGELAGGLHQAKDGAPKLKSGANELSQKGVVKIVHAGADTAQQYGKLYAVLAAGAKRAHTDGMIYGAPAHSLGLMAYDFEINGSDSQSSRNVKQLLVAVGLAGLGLGAFALRRRSVGFLPGL
jgi:putative membrane protein